MPGDQILIDALGAQSEFEHRRNDLLEPSAQAARAGDHLGGALWVSPTQCRHNALDAPADPSIIEALSLSSPKKTFR